MVEGKLIRDACKGFFLRDFVIDDNDRVGDGCCLSRKDSVVDCHTHGVCPSLG